MSRTNKSSRIKGIPARIQLQTKDCVTNTSIVWNDLSAIAYNATSSLNAGFNFTSGSYWYPSSSEDKTTIFLTASANSISADSTPTITYGSTGTLTPFRDSANPGADGKSANNAFYATGSAVELVGEGFSQPLWSKNKIEIDISSFNMRPATLAITQCNNTGFTSGPRLNFVPGLSSPMLYYNFVTKLWEPIGHGLPVGNDAYGNGAANMFQSGTLGFTAGIGYNANPVLQALKGTIADYNIGKTSLLARASASLQCTNLEYFDKMGRITDNYAFPYGPQYHATSSQTLRLSSYITKPFLAEKIVVQMSGVNYTVFDTIKSNGFYPEKGIIYPFAKNSFFILNQRKNRNFNYVPSNRTRYFGGTTEINKNITIPTYKALSSGSTDTYVNTNRDIITFGNITSFTNDFTSSMRRYLVPSPSVNPNFITGSDLTSSMTYLGLVNLSNDYVITQSYYLQDFVTDDIYIQTSQSLATSRMSALGFTGASFTMELDVKTPNIYPNGGVIDPIMSLLLTSSLYDTCDIELGGRNMLGLTNLSGRDLLNSYGTTTIGNDYYGLGIFASLTDLNNYSGDINGLTTNGDYPYITTNVSLVGGIIYSYSPLFVDSQNINLLKQNYNKVNPYLLFPEDELIVGWQQPTPNVLELNTYLSMSISGTFTGPGNILANAAAYVTGVIPNTSTAVTGSGIVHISSLTISGSAKIIIYGSEVAYGSEYNKSLNNQIITSNAIHEVIG